MAAVERQNQVESDPISGGVVSDSHDAPRPGRLTGKRTRDQWLHFFQGRGLLVMLAGMVVVFALIAPNFASTDNLFTVGTNIAALGVMAVAQTFLIIAGKIDVSVGGIMAAAAVTIGLVVDAGGNVWLATGAGLLVAAGLGAVNGLIALKLHVNPIIGTLGTLSLFTGLAFVVAGDAPLLVDDPDFAYVGSGEIGPVPFPLVIFAVVFVAGYLVQRFTVVGHAIYAIGGNREAARLSGLRVDLVPFVLFVLSGLSAGVAAVIITSQLSSAQPEIGAAFLLPVVTAVILGGASLEGGRGKLIGTLIAVAILGVLNDGLALLALSSFIQDMALGIVLLVAVILDQVSTREGRA